jgi:hypothetical protein
VSESVTNEGIFLTWYKVKLSLCQAVHCEDVRGGGIRAPHVLNLSNIWKWMIDYHYCPAAALPQGRVPGDHWVGDL